MRLKVFKDYLKTILKDEDPTFETAAEILSRHLFVCLVDRTPSREKCLGTVAFSRTSGPLGTKTWNTLLGDGSWRDVLGTRQKSQLLPGGQVLQTDCALPVSLDLALTPFWPKQRYKSCNMNGYPTLLATFLKALGGPVLAVYGDFQPADRV